MAAFDKWLRRGIDAGWIGPPCCSTHDGVPLTEAEEVDFEDGGDPCLFIVRLYDGPEHRAAIEANHSPSIWRATNMGIARK